MRLNAYLARAGVASRRKADELIKAGRVRVNGEPGQLNTFVESRDVVEVDGERVAKQALAYVLLNKEPKGRVYFSGAHLSQMPGWQEGAVLSAHRTIGFIANRVGQSIAVTPKSKTPAAAAA